MGYFVKKHIKLMKLNAKEWQTLEDLTYQTSDWKTYTIPEGFIFDGASVPKIFHRIATPMGGNYTKSSCLHDYLYRNKLLPRKECDKLFLEAMQSEGVPRWKRYCMWASVRIGGYFAYHS